MIETKHIEIELSETRSKLQDLSEVSELSEDQHTEISALLEVKRNLEVRFRAAKASEPELKVEGLESPETRERAELEKRCQVGRIMKAVADGSLVDGAERELQTELKLAGNRIPFVLLETRAITPAPVETDQDLRPVIPAVFPMGALAFMGIPTETVATGTPAFTVLETNSAASDHDESASVGETTGSFSSNILKPRRLQAEFFFSREDLAIFPEIDSALRMNLSDALSSGLDKYGLTKTAVGLLDFGTDPTASSAEETFASYRKAIFSQVDGRYAMSAMDVCILVGSDTYAHMAGKYRGTTADDSILDSLMMRSGGVRVSAHVPATDATIQQAVIARGKQHRHAVAIGWNSIEILFDPYTKSATGGLKLTAIWMMNFKVLRAAGFKRFGFKVS